MNLDRLNIQVILFCLVLPTTAFPQPAEREPSSHISSFEQVLAPFDTGTFQGGSVWSAELWVRNDTSEAVNLFPETCFSIGRPFPCERRITIAAATTTRLDVFERDSLSSPGVLLYIPTAQLSNIHLNLRVRNSSDTESAGTEIPLVRERGFFTSTTNLLNVPLDPNFRLTLRVYTPDWVFGRFVVRVHRANPGSSGEDLLTEREFSVSFPTDPPNPPLVPAMLDFSTVFNELAGERGAIVRVSIEPRVGAGARYWPLLTVTSHTSRAITIVTAQ